MARTRMNSHEIQNTRPNGAEILGGLFWFLVIGFVFAVIVGMIGS